MICNCTGRRCWPSKPSQQWRKNSNQLLQAPSQRKHRDSWRWVAPVSLGWGETDDFMSALILFTFVSVTRGQVWASLAEDQPAGGREWGEEEEGGSSERGDPYVSRLSVASVAIVSPINYLWKHFWCSYRLKSRLRQEEEELYQLRHRFQLLEVNFTFPQQSFK